MTDFEGHPLYPQDCLPLFISAGPFKEPAQLEPFREIKDPQMMFAITLGGYTLPDWAGNGEPDFTYDKVQKAAGNSRGLPNGGVEAIRSLKPIIRELTAVGMKTIVQVTNLPHETPIDVIPMLVEEAAEVDPTAVEVNFGCPNGKIPGSDRFHPPLYREPEACEEVLEASRNRVGYDITLGIKDGPHTDSPEVMPNPQTVCNLVASTGQYIDFVAAINTIGNQDFAELKTGKGGMSGPIVAPVAKQHLALWREFASNVPYLSCGGVDTENSQTEIPERLAMGAMLVGGAQEFYRQGHTKDRIWTMARWTMGLANGA
jgi:dihydroorotate dehydrogenase